MHTQVLVDAEERARAIQKTDTWHRSDKTSLARSHAPSACFRTVPYGTGAALFLGAIRRVESSRDCRIRHFRQRKALPHR